MIIKNKIPANFYNVSFVIYQLCVDIQKNIKDYKNLIHMDNELKIKFSNLDYVYIHWIILNMAKLIGVTKSDKSTLQILKPISPKDIKEKIFQFEKKYKNQILKIENNRNRIISHIDISNKNSYFEMGLSKSERIYRINDYKKYLSIIYDYNKLKINIFAKKISNLKPKSIKDEKYSPSDFYKELDIFENMINEILIINYDLSNYFYNN